MYVGVNQTLVYLIIYNTLPILIAVTRLLRFKYRLPCFQTHGPSDEIPFFTLSLYQLMLLFIGLGFTEHFFCIF